VDVIRHETICPDLSASATRGLPNHGAISFVVGIFEESAFSSVPALRHMIGDIRDDDAGEPGQTGFSTNDPASIKLPELRR
jgi:hypothetical protein